MINKKKLIIFNRPTYKTSVTLPKIKQFTNFTEILIETTCVASKRICSYKIKKLGLFSMDIPMEVKQHF